MTRKDAVSHKGELAQYIDHTLLQPDTTQTDIDRLCEEALQHAFKSVCVNSCWASHVAGKLRGTNVLLCTVVGFPLGAMDSRSKAFEAEQCVENGASEVDMVMNIGFLKSGNLKAFKEDVRAVRCATRTNTVLKIIIETGLLSDEEKVLACELSKEAGVDFVKTCTGFLGGRATIEDIALMRRTVGPDIGVKASGGIRTAEEALALIHVGASRIGTSRSVAIIGAGPS